MTKPIGKHILLTAAIGMVLGGIGSLGVRTVSKLSAPLSGPLTTSLMAAGVSAAARTFLEKKSIEKYLDDRCVADGYQYGPICFMAMTFFGTLLMTYYIGPKIGRRQFHLMETACYSAITTTAAVIALLITDPTPTAPGRG